VAQRCQQSSRRNPGQLKLELQTASASGPMNTNSNPHERVGSLFLSYFLRSWIDHSETTAQEDQEEPKAPKAHSGTARLERRSSRRSRQELTGVTGGVGAANKNRFDPLKSAQLEPPKVRLNITKTHGKSLKTRRKSHPNNKPPTKFAQNQMWHVPQSQG